MDHLTIELRQSLENVVVTFTQSASELSGRVAGANGTPVPQTHVVAFSADRRTWFFHSRRVAGVRTDDDGRYVIHNLPDGEYLLAVTDDLETNEWFDPAARAPDRRRRAGFDRRTRDQNAGPDGSITATYQLLTPNAIPLGH